MSTPVPPGLVEIARQWAALIERYDAIVVDEFRSLHDHPGGWDLPARPTTLRVRSTRVTEIDDYLLPDAHSVAFSQMSAEAEAELAAWDEMLHGRMGK